MMMNHSTNTPNTSSKLTISARIVALAALPLLLAGCFNATRTGPLRTEAQTIQPSGATTAKVNLEMAAGVLKLDGGAAEMAQADFAYNVDAWKPVVNYKVTDGTGNLSIRQPDINTSTLINTRNDWNIRLNSQMLTDLHVSLGAGQSTLNLNRMALSALNVECGAGETVIDLSGAWAKSTSVKIVGGVGQLTVRLPKDVGVQVKVETGLGSTSESGLQKNGNLYTNAAFGTSPVTLNLDIEAGVGEVRLEVAN